MIYHTPMHEYPTPSRIICIHTQMFCKTEEPQDLSFVGPPADIARNSWFQYNSTKFYFVQVYQYTLEHEGHNLFID